MIRKISADWIIPISHNPIKNGLITVDSEGKILEISATFDSTQPNIEYYKGVIIPGFINTHCHLELSHMKGLVPTGLGLISFIKEDSNWMIELKKKSVATKIPLDTFIYEDAKWQVEVNGK